MSTSVIVPTFNEAQNVRTLLHRLSASLAGEDQIVIVDDGTDDLPDIAEAERVNYAQHIVVLRRTRAIGGLSGAVIEGIRRSDGDVLVVCDGDLQHPPEVIPSLVRAAEGVQIVVASRYRPGGSCGGLQSRWRRAASRSTGWISKALFPGRLGGCSDPMSGFFAVHRDAVDDALLRPSGFKILLEILVRCGPLDIAEVPYAFAARDAGTSHASAGQGVRFLGQLLRARLSSRAVRFLLVGLSGVLPNLVALWVLSMAGLAYQIAAVLSIQVAIAWNFAGAERFVWQDRAARQRLRRLGTFVAVGELDLLRVPFVVLLVEWAGMSSLVATVLTLAASFAIRFVLADRFVFAMQSPAASLGHTVDEAGSNVDQSAPVGLLGCATPEAAA